ncbi:MAG: Vitamin B12 dependent methionine synthase activation subunit [Ruminococcaceae bacterium]|nr:Vitamin B12 dependent methionine synthase activation subunit [Oscillospiraceae bacterium]
MIAVNTIALSDKSCLSVNKSEVMRYLGVKEMDDGTQQLYNQGVDDAFDAANPRAIYTKTRIIVSENTVDFGFMTVKSEKLAKNLSGCNEAYIFCATLGIGLDRHFERLNKTSPARAMVFSAIGSSLVESLCDYVNNALSEGKDTRPRFSCGYGDFCIEHQKDILVALEAEKRLGIYLTSSYMMVPVKSVTAIIGIRR